METQASRQRARRVLVVDDDPEIIQILKVNLTHANFDVISARNGTEALTKATKRVKTQERIVGKCPNCVTGNLTIIYSRKTRKRFIGCSNYFKGLCKTSFSLPQHGTVKPTGNNCKACGWPQVLVWIRDRRPWRLCFNPDCLLKKKRRKKS